MRIKHLLVQQLRQMNLYAEDVVCNQDLRQHGWGRGSERGEGAKGRGEQAESGGRERGEARLRPRPPVAWV